ncbi:MAG TPA: hypothetical protein EYH40_04245 [Desulfurococcales archaeon]|nr:hypothetical protein [Desulfurococcales archaeon]
MTVINRVWLRETLTYIIYTLLKSREAKEILDEELYEMLKYIVPDLSYRDFLKSLITLEIRGLITVSLIREGVRVIRLVA